MEPLLKLCQKLLLCQKLSRHLKDSKNIEIPCDALGLWHSNCCRPCKGIHWLFFVIVPDGKTVPRSNSNRLELRNPKQINADMS
eukprot:115458-Amphidinium_carterae.1